MKEEKVDWNNILYFKDIEFYLSFTDSIELSMSSLKLRDKLYSEKFKPFLVREYLKKEEHITFESEEEVEDLYESPYYSIREDIQESVNRFEIELKILNPVIETLIIYDQYDFLYGYKIVDWFVNITTLILNSCAITEEMLQYLLNSLKLSKLLIKSASIMCDEDYCTDIIMPQSLKILEIFNANHRHVNIETPFVWYYRENYHGGSGSFYLSKQHIESLISLYYRARGSGNLTEFILMNPQLKSLTLHQYELSSEELIALININQIEHLDSEYSINPLPKSGPHIFESLKSLVTLAGGDINSAFNIAKSCPNLKRLTTYIGNIQGINNSIYYASRLKGLKYYAIKSYKNQIFKEVINLSVMNELTELELTNFNPENFDWSQLSLFPKLNMVKFLGYHVKNNCGSFVPEIQSTKTWKLVPFEDSMTYHKL